MVTLNPFNRRKPSDQTLVDPRNAENAARKQNNDYGDEQVKIIRPRTILMGAIVSLGGLIFGFDTGACMTMSKHKKY